MKKVTRRKIIKTGAAAAGLLAAGCAVKSIPEEVRLPANDFTEPNSFDFIVVGSGAGGGPLTIRLAQAGFGVLLLEAGGTEEPIGYTDIPALHGKATDDPAINWGFFVQRYSEKMQKYDLMNTKYVKKQNNGYGGGVYYPRGTGLGGSTQMNALIHLYPDESDWQGIANATGDKSWNPDIMYSHYQNLQETTTTNLATNVGSTLANAWSSFNSPDYKKPFMHLEQAPLLLLKDATLRKFVIASLEKQGLLNETIEKALQLGNAELNPNNPAYIKNKADGLFSIPFNVKNGRRFGVRNKLIEMEKSGKYPNLKIQRGALCKRVLFSESVKNKVVGVEYSIGNKLYNASSAGSGVYQLPNGKLQFDGLVAKARREVIIAGGAFNSPQLLMLSGIGDPKVLSTATVNVPVRINLPGVGKNLQDRYEVTVVSELKDPIAAIEGCTWLQAGDRCTSDWSKNNMGHVYSTNGTVISNLLRSSPTKKDPDLNIFGVPGNFVGYYPNWSQKSYESAKYFSWAILKGHTNNISGWVKLKSADYRETPEINFNYFNSESDPTMDDLTSTVKGFKKARAINKSITDNTIVKEYYPGSNIQTDEQIKEFVLKESWGHHASCSNKMGAKNDPNAVVDSEFKVIGTEGLRVVDASVFPRIPGLFICLPTMIISEKAADLLIKKYKV